MTKTLDYYLRLPYQIVLTPDEDGGWNAEIPVLPGCVAWGEDSKLTWISGALNRGYPIPEPKRQTA